MSNNTVQPGKPIYDRKQFTRPMTTTDIAPDRQRGQPQEPTRPKEVVKLITRAERDEYLWFKQRLGRRITILLRTGDRWERCLFVRVNTFTIIVKNQDGVECLLFKHAIAAIYPEAAASVAT